MAKRMKHGIRNNLSPVEGFDPKFRRDMRRTAEVEESRDPTNGKPFRTARQKEEARQAVKRRKGAFFSTAPRNHHPDRLDPNGYPR